MLPVPVNHMRSSGALGAPAQLVVNVAPPSVLMELVMLVRPCRSEKYNALPGSTYRSVSPPPTQVAGLPGPTVPGTNWYELPLSRDDQRKLCVVEKPNGTLVKTLPLGATLTSGSNPGRCWSTITACEKPSAAGVGARAVLLLASTAPAAAATAIAHANATSQIRR